MDADNREVWLREFGGNKNIKGSKRAIHCEQWKRNVGCGTGEGRMKVE